MSALDDLLCKPGNLRQPCQYCGQHSTGLCSVLVSRRIEALEVRIDEAAAWLRARTERAKKEAE